MAQKEKREKNAYVFSGMIRKVVNPFSAYLKRLEREREGKCKSWLNSDSANLKAVCVCCQAKQAFRKPFVDDDDKLGINKRQNPLTARHQGGSEKRLTYLGFDLCNHNKPFQTKTLLPNSGKRVFQATIHFPFT